MPPPGAVAAAAPYPSFPHEQHGRQRGRGACVPYTCAAAAGGGALLHAHADTVVPIGPLEPRGQYCRRQEALGRAHARVSLKRRRVLPLKGHVGLSVRTKQNQVPRLDRLTARAPHPPARRRMSERCRGGAGTLGCAGLTRHAHAAVVKEAHDALARLGAAHCFVPLNCGHHLRRTASAHTIRPAPLCSMKGRRLSVAMRSLRPCAWTGMGLVRAAPWLAAKTRRRRCPGPQTQ
jgi:hypothetical protein